MHKKTLNIAAVCVVVLLVTFLYVQKNNKTAIEKQNNISIENTQVNKTLQIEDYQQEIIDTITKQQLESFEKVSDSFKKKDTDTLSAKIAKDVFGQYIEYNTSGTLDAATLQNMTVNNMAGQIPYTPTVRLNNLKLSAPTIGNLKIYINKIATIQFELDKAIASISNKPNPDIYIKNLYIAASNLYYRQAVPSSMGDYHANIINAYRKYVTAFNLMQMQQQDPARALLGVDMAKKAGDELISNINNIRNIAILNKITYEPKDPAFQWINTTENSTINKVE